MHISSFSRLVLLFFIFLLHEVNGQSGFLVKEFVPIANEDWNRNPVFDVDLDSAIVNGIRIPTTKQLKDGAFRFSFKIENTAGQQLYYKILYQSKK